MPKKGEKNFISSTISTRLGPEHSQKNSKAIQKIKKNKNKIKKRHSSFVSSQIRLGQAKKDIIFFFFFGFQVPFLPNPGWRIPKKIQKIKKHHLVFISI